MLRFVTAGESHGQALIAWISGLPAGLPVDLEFIGREPIEGQRLGAAAHPGRVVARPHCLGG